MSRQRRADIARQTDRIVRGGGYLAPSGAAVTIADDVRAAVDGTVLYLPEQVESWGWATAHAARRAVGAGAVGTTAGGPTRIEVTDESTLAAARRLVGAARDPVACLNFASARKPGGGYRSGAQAQEESLARSSALVACLEATPEFYRCHEETRDARYSDRIIYSPGVPVFRDDYGTLLDESYQVAFLTAAAPNVSAITDPAHLAEVPAILLRRAGKVLAVAQRHDHRRLVLGAWGCGVFGNDPSTVAGAFARLLTGDGGFAGAFSHVVFAILDHDPRGARQAAFRAAFGG